jgi:hypothetical protein
MPNNFFCLFKIKLNLFKPKQQECWPFVKTLHEDGAQVMRVRIKTFAILLA